jgi:hypothetical protein
MKTFELIKQVVNEAAPVPTTTKEILKAMSAALVGSKVKAYGKKSRGLWGKNDEEMTFVIKAIRPHYFDEENDGSKTADGVIDIVLDGYKASKHDLIYTDSNFLKSFKELLDKKKLTQYVKSVGYSEQGMQGNNFVNMDLQIKKPKAVK